MDEDKRSKKLISQKKYREKNKESLNRKRRESYKLLTPEQRKKCLERTNAYKQNNRDLTREKSRQAYAKNPKHQRMHSVKSAYKLTFEEYQSLIDKHGNCCHLCKTPEVLINPRTKIPINLAVDHDHKTGIIRGLLCNRCNLILGRMQDDPKLLILAAEYVDPDSVLII
jgi:hypothetical protein